jgi:hypothetical protein
MSPNIFLNCFFLFFFSFFPFYPILGISQIGIQKLNAMDGRGLRHGEWRMDMGLEEHMGDEGMGMGDMAYGG